MHTSAYNCMIISNIICNMLIHILQLHMVHPESGTAEVLYGFVDEHTGVQRRPRCILN